MDSSAANVGLEVGSLVLDELFLPLFCYGSAFSRIFVATALVKTHPYHTIRLIYSVWFSRLENPYVGSSNWETESCTQADKKVKISIFWGTLFQFNLERLTFHDWVLRLVWVRDRHLKIYAHPYRRHLKISAHPYCRHLKINLTKFKGSRSRYVRKF